MILDGKPIRIERTFGKNGLPLQERLVICVQRRDFGRIEDRQKVQFALFPSIERSVIHLGWIRALSFSTRSRALACASEPDAKRSIAH